MKTKTKPSHRIIAMFFMLTFLQTLIPYNQLWANNNGPMAPEAASFEPVDATDMVNLLTGDLSYVLPLLNVPSPEGGYPLALSYHGGIAMDQEASWVGLGWNLNPGAINRSVTKSPDDWYNAKTYSVITSGVNTSYGGSLSIGIGDYASIGVYMGYSENRAFNGETEYKNNFGIQGSVGLGEDSPFSINGSIGTNGASIGLGFSGGLKNGIGFNAGIGVSQSFENGNTYVSGSAGVGISKSGQRRMGQMSTGISLSTNQGLGVKVSGATIGLNNSIGGEVTANVFSRRIGIHMYWFNLTYSMRRSWVFEADYTINQGALYAGNMDKVLEDSIIEWKVDFDSYESYNQLKHGYQLARGNYSFVGYDNYSVSGQGIAGLMKPAIIEPGYLYNRETTISPTSGDRSFNRNIYPSSSKKFKKSIDNTFNDIHFYFQNEYSSYLSLDTGNWNTNLLNYPSEIFNYETTNNNILSELNGKNMYNSGNGRLKKGKHIETFTNEQIINNPNIIISNSNLNRNDPKMTPSKGIGAFKITAIDGKTYHYTIPVYQREQVTRKSDILYNIDLNYTENQQFEPYATHWLLTAITGPDYIDTNFDNKVNKSDYGYWVAFDYGKWSDGYSWRNPRTGETAFEKTKSYSWGVKDIYYLDKVQTRTHTALFIKEDRSDDKSSIINIPRNSNNLDWKEDIHHGLFLEGNDGRDYLSGIYSLYHHNTRIDYGTSFHGYKFKTKKHKSLRLNKIVVLNNKDLPSSGISKTNTGESSPKNMGEIEVKERFDGYELASGRKILEKTVPVHYRNWEGEFYSNVLDVKDIDALSFDLIEKATEIIDFNYDESYPLARGSHNSDASNGKGRLTLKSLAFGGHKGTNLVPPYKFQYQKPHITFDKDQIDPWGFHKSHPDAWSLKSIETPIGSNINIKYEPDSYHKEIVNGDRVFNNFLQFAFVNDATGNKFVFLRNDPIVVDKVDFREYFEAGKEAFIDVQYWRHPPGNTSHRIGDVAKYSEVSSVASNLVVFKIPRIHHSPYVRRGANCNAINWVHYTKVEELNGQWFGKIDSQNCGDPRGTSNGTRSKYTFFSNRKPNTPNTNGGLRVSELTITDGVKKYKSTYNYDDPSTGESSGITIYAPEDYTKNIDFITELPSPQVMYQNVRVSNYANNESIIGHTDYKFNVFKDISYTPEGFELDDFLSLNKQQDYSKENVYINSAFVDINFSKHKLIDNTSKLGTLISTTRYNSKNQVMSKIINEYGTVDDKQGVFEESFKIIKTNVSNDIKKRYFLNTSTKKTKLTVLKKTTNHSQGFSNYTEFKEFDDLTGKSTLVENQQSDGKLFRSKEILAKDIPQYNPSSGYGMGSKANNTSNKNMLTQSAATLTQIKKDNTWKTIAANIMTWNNDWKYIKFDGDIEPSSTGNSKIWRKHKTFAWKGDLDTDGTYVGYIGNDDEFDWTPGTSQTNTKWINTSTTTLYDHYSKPLEAMDINKNRASTKMGDNASKVIATANAKYTDMYYSGAEYIANDNGNNGVYLDGEVKTYGNVITVPDAHTGNNVIRINSGTAFEAKLPADTERTDENSKFKVSVWVRKGQESNVSIMVQNGTSFPFVTDFKSSETIIAGDWVLLNGYINILTNEAIVSITSDRATDLDDFRLLPLSSSMTSYVYNQWDELSHVIGDNNLATKYEYDQAGRLVRTYLEVITAPGVPGGFKKSKEINYNYKKVAQIDTNGDGIIDPVESYPPLQLGLYFDNYDYYSAKAIANGYGGSGKYQYRWAVSDSPLAIETASFGAWGSNNEKTVYTDCDKTVYVKCQVKDIETEADVKRQKNRLRTCSDNPIDIVPQ
ncbi:hypothetical protein [Aquimarina mytili]|uniref:Uncharacterized protein n=1 Tax=Aquimarina mytili TaxID=874423 RepID=A0A936ZU32_9FLAO|nr:hypothetical protein [Aquimarina mytili]MBL0685574.1 hypothetical protein [Aquimarina mytili]